MGDLPDDLANFGAVSLCIQQENYAMTPKQILALIRDELDSRQIFVTLTETPFGVKIKGDYASTLIARTELRKRGIQPLC